MEAAAMAYLTPQQYQNQQQNLPFLMLLKLLTQGQDAQTEARSANEKRVGDILDRDVDTRNRLIDYTKQFGKSMTDDVERADKALRGRDTSAMAAAGFLGASPDIMRGADIAATRARNENLAKVKDYLLQNAVNIDERASNRLSDFQERITDAYPKDNTALLGQLGSVGDLLGGLFGGGGGGAYGSGLFGGPNANGNVLRAGVNAARPVQYIRQQAPVAPRQSSEVAGMQADSAAQAMNATHQLPWNYGNNPGANPASQVPSFIPAPGGGMMNERQSMPALGVFGAGVQMADAGGQAAYPFPYQASRGYSRIPLIDRDPVFASVLAKRGRGGFQVAGPSSSTSVSPLSRPATPSSYALSTNEPANEPNQPTWLARIAPILQFIGPYLNSIL